MSELTKGDRVFLPEFFWCGTVNWISGEECQVSMDYPTYFGTWPNMRPLWTLLFLVKDVVKL